MNAVKALELIKSRRSTRKYLDRPVEPEKIGQILEAGRYAPSGGNSQTTHFLVISNKEILRELAALVMQEFAKMEVTENMYASIANSIRASKGGKYFFHYNAPVLILVANRRDYGNNMADSSCALENMMTSISQGSGSPGRSACAEAWQWDIRIRRMGCRSAVRSRGRGIR